MTPSAIAQHFTANNPVSKLFRRGLMPLLTRQHKKRAFSIVGGCIAVILLFSSLQLVSALVLSKILQLANHNVAQTAALRQQQVMLDRSRMALVIASDKLNRAGVYFMEDKETGSVGSWNSLLDEAQAAIKESQQSYQQFLTLNGQTPYGDPALLATLNSSYQLFLSGIVEEAEGLSKNGNIDAFFNVPIQAFQSDFNDKYFQYQSASVRQSEALSSSLLNSLLQAKGFSVAALVILALIAAGVWWGVNQWISRPLKRINSRLQIMAAGDLSGEAIPLAQGSREVRQLAENMRHMQQGLVTLVEDVRAASGHISVNIEKLVKGNEELRIQSATQGGALAEASDHLLALNDQVKNNVAHAQAANQQSERARGLATDGSLVMEKVEQSMEGIVCQSTEMSGIVALIESVAFQTNILALNAAIEAAHAGAHGRGFAVVAREVGLLASKSSQSSKDIQQLIRSSLGQIDQGAHSVGQLGENLQQVMTVISGLSARVQEITDESVHQSQSIDDVAARISTLNKVTERNHTLVDRAASSSAQLSGQCQNLQQAIARFQLP